jgi:hypothetical protein
MAKDIGCGYGVCLGLWIMDGEVAKWEGQYEGKKWEGGKVKSRKLEVRQSMYLRKCFWKAAIRRERVS